MVDAAPRSAARERARSGVKGSIRRATASVTQTRRESAQREPDEPRQQEPFGKRVRRSPARLWHAYLHDRTVRMRVLTLLAVPLLAASLLGGLLLGRAVQDAIRADHATELAEVTRDALVAAESLQDERDTGALHGGKPLSQEINDARATSDAALRTLRRSIAELNTSGLPDQTKSAVTSVERRLDDIAAIRQDQDYLQTPFDSTGGAPFSQLVRSIIELSTQMSTDASSARNVEALTALAEASDLASAERGLVASILVGGKNPDQGQVTELTASKFSQDRLIDRALDRVQNAEFRDGLNAVRAPMAAARTTVMEWREGPPPESLTGEDWYQAASDRIDVLRGTQGELVDTIVDNAASRADRARLAAILTLIGLILVLALAITLTLAVASSIVRPLRNLHTAALRIAKKDLPELVHRVRDEGPKALRSTDSGIQPESNDEIGAVASAFNDVYATAVQVTGQQALLRQNLDTIVVNLSRRTQTLVDRQLREIEHLEGSERDPDQLATLFRIDHLATRVQRHAESLLVLAGVDSSTKTPEPVPLLDVVRAAAGEVEQYDRVRFGMLPTELVSARAVDDVAHLIAELLDNATEFSPPATTVLVDCQRVAGGKFRITVADQGLGIAPSRLAELNERLGAPGDIDVAASRTLGLYVVARLAARHGITVRLEAPAKGGTIALIDLPASVMAKTQTTEPDAAELDREATTGADRDLRVEAAALSGNGDRPSQPGPEHRPDIAPRPAGLPGRPAPDGRPAIRPEPGRERRMAEPQPQFTESGLPRREPSEIPARQPVGEAPAERTPEPIPDPLTDPRLRKIPQPGQAEHETPIYSALRSSWFRRAAADGSLANPDEWRTPADEGWRKAAAVSRRTEALSALPRNGTPPAPEVRSPAAAAEQPATPSGASGPVAPAPAGQAAPGGQAPQATPGPEAPAAAGPVSTPVSGRPKLPPRTAQPVPVDEPTPAPVEPELTQAGLPLRQRGAALVPGTIAASRATEDVRDASAVRSTLSTLIGGVSRGRDDARDGAEPPPPDGAGEEGRTAGDRSNEGNDQ